MDTITISTDDPDWLAKVDLAVKKRRHMQILEVSGEHRKLLAQRIDGQRFQLDFDDPIRTAEITPLPFKLPTPPEWLLGKP
jgi:hypothetical protein